MFFFKSEKGKKDVPGRRNGTSIKMYAVEKEPLPQLEHSLLRSEKARIEREKAGMISTI